MQRCLDTWYEAVRSGTQGREVHVLGRVGLVLANGLDDLAGGLQQLRAHGVGVVDPRRRRRLQLRAELVGDVHLLVEREQVLRAPAFDAEMRAEIGEGVGGIDQLSAPRRDGRAHALGKRRGVTGRRT